MTQPSRPAVLLWGVPWYVYVITILTTLYLVVELSFNARLLDVIGGASPPEVVHSIEYWGRGISGAALALAVWGMGIMPRAYKKRWPLGGTLIILIVSAAASGWIMWTLQRSIVNYFVDRSSGIERRLAMKLNLVERNAVLGWWGLQDITLTADLLQSPEGKSFLSLMPFMASSFEGVETKIDMGLAHSNQLLAASQIGTPLEFYNRVFAPSVNQIYVSYTAYVDGNNAYQDALVRIPQQTQAAWSDYLAGLGKSGFAPRTLPRSLWAQVASSERSKGIPVSPGWEPDDKAGFVEATQRALGDKAEAAYEAKARLPDGDVFPKGLTLDEFELLPGIQKRWHDTLHLSGNARLTHGLNGQKFVETVYSPVAAAIAARALRPFALPGSNYADGGPAESAGRDAMALLIVPPIALAFSLAGALVHLFKISNYLARIGVGWAGDSLQFNPTPMIAVVVVGVALSAFLLSNEITRSKLFDFEQREMYAKGQAVPAVVCRWVVQAQPYFWPVNEWIRVNVLRGFAF
jgi:hypothetical protein